MPRNPNSPHNPGCGPMHTHISASENIKLQMMMAKLEDSLKNEFVLKDQLKTINSELLIGSGNIDITCIDRIEKTASEGLIDTYTIYFTNGSESYFTVTNGAKGDKGDIGIQGEKGDAGIDGRGISSLVVNTEGELIVTYTDETEVNLGRIIGADGNTGAEGATGKSAYEVAQENGYTGTVQEWLDSLKGEQGIQGIQGETGKSAYQSWLDSGYTGTEAEFTVWLKGEKGDTGEKGADGYTPVKGVDYLDGKDGQNGKDGISPIFRILENIWEVSYDNGVTYVSTGINAVGPAGKDGEQGPTGKDGISVTKSEINESGELVLTFSDNKTVNVGKVVGADGKNGTNGSDGVNGENGKDGVGVVETEITGDGELVITYTNGTSANLGKVVGSDGKDGQPGIDGAKGEDGAPGLNGTDGKSAYELWLDLGHSGSEEDFINSLKGESGKDGQDGKNGLTTAIQIGETVYEHVDGTISLPEFLTEHQSLEGYATVAALNAKADNIPFTEDLYVTKTTGNFVVGESVKDLSIKQILAKLLGLSNTKPDENPDIPDEPTTISEKIIANGISMHQVNELGELIEIPYKYKEFTTDEYATAPTQDCFYQLKDAEGNILESGYQHMSEENDSMYYVVLLPKELDFATNVSVQSWDAVQNEWSYDNVSMSSDLALIEEAFSEADLTLPTYDADKYTLWIDTSLDTCSGIDYRFIIKE